jgi:hypothetical protein
MKPIPSLGPGAPATAAPDRQDHSPYVRKGPKQSYDSAEGCRENARFDTAHAAGMATSNARSKYEHSAASWTARADLLQRIDDSKDARAAALAAADL